MVGLGSTKFRSAQYTSHEVVVDEEQIAWFEKTIADHPASEGWKVFCFSHATLLTSRRSGARCDRRGAKPPPG